MGLIDKLVNYRNNSISKQLFGFVDNSPIRNTAIPQIPVFPNWFFSARIGQPRNINLLEVRAFAKSAWVQMVLNTIKKEIMTIEWDIVNVDEKDNEEYLDLKMQVKDFFNNINANNETIEDLWSQVITDVGEIDAGVAAKEFSIDSYEEQTVPLLDAVGNENGTEQRIVLKEFGKRKLNEIRAADGGSFLKQIDIYKRIKNYYQYSFKNPRQAPIRFENDEIVYFIMNQRSYELYGFSPVQAIQQVLEILIQSTRWNKDFFRNNAIPDGIIGLEDMGKTSKESLKEFKNMWMQEAKGKPHKLLFTNAKPSFTNMASSSRDMEYLDGQKWFFHLVFGVFGVSPVEAGFHENVNQGNQAGQERVTVKNAIKPYLEMLSKKTNRFIINELLQEKNPPIKLKFFPHDHSIEQIQHEQNMKELDMGALTINEYRNIKGKEPVSWGNEPFSKSPSFESSNSEDEQENPKSNDDAKRQRRKEKITTKLKYINAFKNFVSRK